MILGGDRRVVSGVYWNILYGSGFLEVSACVT